MSVVGSTCSSCVHNTAGLGVRSQQIHTLQDRTELCKTGLRYRLVAVHLQCLYSCRRVVRNMRGVMRIMPCHSLPTRHITG